MAKIITAHFAERTIKIGGKPKVIAAFSNSFSCDENGKWSNEFGRILEIDVIDACKSATNWSQIRAEHFPMAGFHS